MRCPKCQNEFSRMYYDKVPVDFCRNCKGVWFDAADMNQAMDNLADREDTPNAIIELEKNIVSEIKIKEKPYPCPHCGKEMKKINYAYDSNIIIDKCEDCQGVWTDRDEIMRLAVFRKGNPILDRMGKAIAKDRGEALSSRYSDNSSVNIPTGWFTSFGLRIILPVGDDQERFTFPFVVIGIIAINIAVFLFQSCYFGSESIQNFYYQFGLVPSSVFSSVKGGYSFLTCMFIHAGIWHLAGNMLFLLIFADNIEDRFGHFKFIILYFFFGLAAAALHIFMEPNSNIPAIGASGAISGTMGAYLILYPNARIKTLVYEKIIDIPAFAYLGGWFMLQLLFAYLEKDRIGGGVGWFAHIGGFVAGISVGLWAKFRQSLKLETQAYKNPADKLLNFDPRKI